MKRLFLIIVIALFCYDPATAQENKTLLTQYFKLLENGVKRIEAKWKSVSNPTLKQFEGKHLFAHFPHAILIPAVLYAHNHPANNSYKQSKYLQLALAIGDMLVSENRNGNFSKRHDSDWDTYMWMEAYRLLEKDLGETRRKTWREAILENVQPLEVLLNKYKDHPAYNAPYIVTSPNHYAIYASTVLVAGHIFSNKSWIVLSSKVLHRFCTEEQSSDGFWGEHSNKGPTTGYDYVTATQIGLYWEYSKDTAALGALRRSLDFHMNYTYMDGTPVETINDRNRYWGVSMWGHFGFSHFDEGRKYAQFLTSFFPEDGDPVSYGGDMQSIARIAQNVLYYHEGEAGPIPQEKRAYVHRMHVPAGIRKEGLWTATYSGIIAPAVSLNNFFLDRQSHFSVFHQQTGLIITGANSKHQPELATFTEDLPNDHLNMPVSSDLRMSDSADELSLAYNVFFATIRFYKPSEANFEFDINTHYKWGQAKTQMNLQLVLKNGAELITGSGKKYVLGTTPLKLDSVELGGEIRHNGWTMKIPPSATLYWPVYPFNPYIDAPEKETSKAVGRLTVSLKLEDQRFHFKIGLQTDSSWEKIKPWSVPPYNYKDEFGGYRNPLIFYNGREVATKRDWEKRKQEIRERWHSVMGKWPPLIERPVYKIRDSLRRGAIMQYTIELGWRKDESTVGYLLIPDLPGKKPAVLTVFYEPESAIGVTRPFIDYAYQLAQKGFVTLSLGVNYLNRIKPFAQYYPEYNNVKLQPLSMLAYLASNAGNMLAHHAHVDSSRIGMIGFSYGSKWTMFASCLYEKFAAAVWIDGGVVFDESRPNVNYWEPWYLGSEVKGIGNAYKTMKEKKMDLVELHSLMAPRPFIVSGGSEDSLDRWVPLNHTIRVNKFLGFENRVLMHNRKEHTPNDEANEVIIAFFDHFLK